MKKLLSIVICMSMLLSLAYIPVSAAGEDFVPATELFFDDFTAARDDYTINDSFMSNTWNKPILSVTGGKLNVGKGEVTHSGNAELWGLEIPSSAVRLPDDDTSGTGKYVIEFQFSTSYGYNGIGPYVGGKRLFFTPGKSSGNVYYGIVDGSTGQATGYYPANNVLTAGTPVTDLSIAEGLGVGFVAPNRGSDNSAFDYIAVYTLEDSFDAALTNVKSTSATLKTNMPLNLAAADTGLTMGGKAVTITKTANTYNTYTLTFEDTLVDGTDYTLSGTVNTVGSSTNENVSIGFTFEKQFEPAEVLFFDDFTAARSDYSLTTPFASATWAGTADLTVTNGKLNVGATDATGSESYAWGFRLPTLTDGAGNTGKYVVEFQLASSYGYQAVGPYAGGKRLFWQKPISAGGVYYALVDGSAGQATGYYPVNNVLTAGTVTGLTVANDLGVGFVCPTNATLDYIAVYELASAFEGKAEGIDTTKATLKTNMPLDLAQSTVTVEGETATVTKNDNAYNEYTVHFASEVAINVQHTMTVDAVPLGGTADNKQTAELTFTVDTEAPEAGFFDDFSDDTNVKGFTLIESTTNIEIKDGKISPKINNSDYGFPQFEIPADMINSALHKSSDKFIIEWDVKFQNPYNTNSIFINGTQVFNTYVNRQYLTNGKYYVVYDRSAHTATMYLPDYDPQEKTGIPADSGAGFSLRFQTANEMQGTIEIDYIAVYPIDDSFDFEVSNATEGSALMTTDRPIDLESTVTVDGVDCTVEKLDNTCNKYILRPATAFAAGASYTAAASAKFIDGTALTAAENATFTAAAGSTQITGIDVAADANGRKVAKITGTNNIVGVSPVVLVAKYANEVLSEVDYANVILPFDGENGAFEAIAEGPSVADDSTEGTTFNAFIWENMSNVKPMR